MSLARPADLSAQWIVYDPTNYINAVLRYYQLIQQYKLMFDEAKRIAGMTRYRRDYIGMLKFRATDESGKTARLAYALNNRLPAEEVDAIFREATLQLERLNRVLVTADDPLRYAYATGELLDGSTREGIRTMGQLRSLQQDIERSVKSLEVDALSGGGDLQSQTAIMQKTSAASLIIARELQSTNQLLVQLYEQQMLSNRAYRDGQALTVNGEIKRRLLFDDMMRSLKNATVPEIRY